MEDKSIATDCNGLPEVTPTNLDYKNNRKKSAILPALHQHGSLGVVGRQCKTYDGQQRLYPSRRPWDAWEKRSLKKQERDTICQQSSSSNGYTRGPEILNALEKLLSRSYS